MSQEQKCGHLPPKEAEIKPWETLCLDSIGPYAIKRPPKLKKAKRKKWTMESLMLKAVTMTDPATGWLKVA